MSVYKSINAVQSELSKNGITKDRTNTQGSGYKFRGIDDYPHYLFSDDGRVWSIRSKKFLTPLNVPNGYQHCVLVECGVKYRHSIHRLMAKAFHGEPEGSNVVNHKNGIKTDNRHCNLEWISQSENVKHSYKNGFRKINAAHIERAGKLGRSKRTVSDNQIALMKSLYFGERGDIARISRSLGLSRDVVSYHLIGVKN